MTNEKQTEWKSVTTNYGTEDMPDLVRTLEMQRAGRNYRLHIGNTHPWAEIIDSSGKVISSIDYRGERRGCGVFNPEELLEVAEDFYKAVTTAHARRNLDLLFGQGDCVSRERSLTESYARQARLPGHVSESEAELNSFRRKHGIESSDLVNAIRTTEEVC